MSSAPPALSAGSARTPISGRAVATGGVLPTIFYLGYKYGLVGRLGWPEMPELEAILPGAAVAILAWMHHRAEVHRESRDRRFLLTLVRSGIVIPIPPGSPVVEIPPPPAPPAMPAGG